MWEQLAGGALRFRGTDTMGLVLGLIRGDPAYHYTLAPWPHDCIDVYPVTVEAQNLLLALVNQNSGGS